MIKAKSFHNWTSRLPIQGNPLVSMVIAAHESVDTLMCLLYSLRSQTYTNWEAIVIHDGPNTDAYMTNCAFMDLLQADPNRIKFEVRPEHKGHWGHPHRQYGISLTKGEYMGMSNDDNYYAPVYFETMLSTAIARQSDFVYCNMVHSHMHWLPFPTFPKKGRIDLGGWIATGSMVRDTPWTDNSFEGDGTYIENLVAKSKNIAQVYNYLFVHNLWYIKYIKNKSMTIIYGAGGHAKSVYWACVRAGFVIKGFLDDRPRKLWTNDDVIGSYEEWKEFRSKDRLVLGFGDAKNAR